MKNQTVVGTLLTMSGPIANMSANAIGIAKTGAAIGTLHGAAHASATAAWVGLGSMKVGMFMMGAAPIIGAALILDSICGRDHGSPMIDWYEEFWRQYELQEEVENLKKNPDLWVESKTTNASLTRLDQQFQNMELDDELELLKKQLDL
jgi:hypothetical protein